jgi:hypothetical protein
VNGYVDLLVVFVTSVAGAGIGAYVGAYLREKGKNLATHEDVDMIVAQLRKTTDAAERIRAEIAGGLWEQQNRWTLKRDIYVRLLEALGIAFLSTKRLLQVESSPSAERMRLQEWAGRLAEEQAEAIASVHRTTAVALIILGEDAQRALGRFEDEVTKSYEQRTFQGALERLLPAIGDTYKVLREAAKADLVIPRTPLDAAR